MSLTSLASEKALGQPASLLEEGSSSQKKDVQVVWKEFPSRGAYFSSLSTERIWATILDEVPIFQSDKLSWKE